MTTAATTPAPLPFPIDTMPSYANTLTEREQALVRYMRALAHTDGDRRRVAKAVLDPLSLNERMAVWAIYMDTNKAQIAPSASW